MILISHEADCALMFFGGIIMGGIIALIFLRIYVLSKYGVLIE